MEYKKTHFNWSKAFVCSVKTDANKKHEGRSFAEVAEDLNKTLPETICHLLVSCPGIFWSESTVIEEMPMHMVAKQYAEL